MNINPFLWIKGINYKGVKELECMNERVASDLEKERVAEAAKAQLYT